MFITNVTNKVHYRDSLRTWAEIVRSFAKSDLKEQAKLEMMVIIVYISCYEEAKSKFRAAEREETITRRVIEGDEDRSILIKMIITTFAHDTPAESVQRKVYLLLLMHQFKRAKNESMKAYINLF